MRPLRWLLISCVLSGCTYDPPQRPATWYENPEHYSDNSATHSRRAAFQAYLDHAVQEGLPGAVLLIRTPEEGTWVGASGFADIASQVPWKPDMIGRVGSVSKLFAAAVILKLVDQSVLSLDSCGCDHLPNALTSKIANAEVATVSQLLHHTSGTFNYLESTSLFLRAAGSYDYDYQSKEALLEYAFGEPASFSPGAGWEYSNTNFLLLQTVAEQASGQSGKALLESMVIEPLGLRSTRYDPAQPAPTGLARGYGDLFADGKPIDVTDTALERFHYDGGVIANVYDIADLLDTLLTGPFFSEGARAAFTDYVPTGGNSKRGVDYYGAGLIVEQSPEFGPVYGHSGTTMGFSAHVYHLAQFGITFAAIVNGSQHTLEERSYRWFSPLKYDDVLRLVVGQH